MVCLILPSQSQSQKSDQERSILSICSTQHHMGQCSACSNSQKTHTLSISVAFERCHPVQPQSTVHVDTSQQVSESSITSPLQGSLVAELNLITDPQHPHPKEANKREQIVHVKSSIQALELPITTSLKVPVFAEMNLILSSSYSHSALGRNSREQSTLGQPSKGISSYVNSRLTSGVVQSGRTTMSSTSNLVKPP